MKYCGEQGCKTLISKGRYCESHKRRSRKAKQSKYKSFYNTQAWRDLKAYCYQRDGGRCVECKKFVFGKWAQHHHKIPIQVRPDLKLVEDNVVTVCPSCHTILEQECDKQYNHLNKKNNNYKSFNWKV
ncbi:HNH endonuclease [Bacillus sp. JJ722]|uniref:HNH endonuclease n=1 Tax=Bacillus sp. JJ722 TaxID=3122973 RepID=UPI002FFFF7B0